VLGPGAVEGLGKYWLQRPIHSVGILNTPVFSTKMSTALTPSGTFKTT